MATNRILKDQTITTEVDLASGDRLIIAQGGAIARTDAAPAVRVLGPEAYVRNSGTISVATAGAALTGALSGDLSVRLVNEGEITGTAGAVAYSSAAGTTGDFRLINSGTISGGTSQAVTLKDLHATGITIVNEQGGLLTNSGAADVLRPGNDGDSAITVINSGTIQAGPSSGGDGIDFQPQDGGLLGNVVNHETGLIEGAKHGITGANAALIVNDGGEIVGRNGSGINFDTELGDGDGAVRVVNSGLISGRYNGSGDGDGDGVDVDYVVDIRNDGRIEGVGADNIDDFADGVAAGGGVIRNRFAAEIYGETNGILIDDGDRGGGYAETRIINDGYITGELGYGVRLIGDFADALSNRGTISATEHAAAAVDMGGGDDAVVNKGDIDGDVLLGAGNDLLRGGTVLGTIFGGEGDDTIKGGSQDDTINGGLGFDHLAGGRGVDTYVFADVAESSTDLTRADLIDWRQGDVIDLSAIDADTTQDGDQAFTLSASGEPSGVAGELVFANVAPGLSTIGGDVDGDGTLDFVIRLSGVDDPTLLSFNL